ncbi:MAG: hypothetical protein RI967_2152 [Planctomycetota bacterium]
MPRVDTPPRHDLRAILGRAVGVWPFLGAGVVATLLLAWAVPVLLALRGIGPAVDPVPLRFASVAAVEGRDERKAGEAPRLLVARGVASDLVRATRNASGEWPSPPFERAPDGSEDGVARDTRGGWTRLDTVPTGWTVAPTDADGPFRWHSVSTTLAGLPFRAFRGESRASLSDGEGARATIGAIEVATLAGEPVLLPFSPIPVGLAIDIAFWTAVSWAAVAFPQAIRRKRRARLGRCSQCAHELDPRLPARPDACPACGHALAPDPFARVRSPEMHFQNSYVWLVFVSSLDIMLTWRILDRGGSEVNPVAALVIDAWGMHGAVAFKFAVMTGVIVMCESLARMRMSAGRFLATAAVAISAAPVAWSLFLLAVHRFAPTALGG